MVGSFDGRRTSTGRGTPRRSQGSCLVAERSGGESVGGIRENRLIERYHSTAGSHQRESLAQRRKGRGRCGNRLDGRGRFRERYRRLHRVAGRARVGEGAEGRGRPT